MGRPRWPLLLGLLLSLLLLLRTSIPTALWAAVAALLGTLATALPLLGALGLWLGDARGFHCFRAGVALTRVAPLVAVAPLLFRAGHEGAEMGL